SVVAVPGWRRNLHCVCVHLSLHEAGRNRQLEAISGRLEELASRDLPIIVAGDFNDWRHRASSILERRLGMTEVSLARFGRAARAQHAAEEAFEQRLRYRRGAIDRARGMRRVREIAGRTEALGETLDEAARAVEIFEVEIGAGARTDQKDRFARVLARDVLNE